MKRREFLKTTGGAFLAAGAASWNSALAGIANDPQSGSPLNLLFITADDMNATMPGWMGNPLKPTPNMDAFAATCHRFVNNRASAPICQPSRESIMTGLVPHHSGGLGFNPIKEGVPTLVTVLQAQGYFTAAFNKLEHMKPNSCFPWDHHREDSGKNPNALADQVTASLAQAGKLGKPFFINCNITDPHRPFYGSAKAEAIAKAPQDLPRPFTVKDVIVPSFMEDIPEVRLELAQYYNSVQRLDKSFGEVIAALDKSGHADRTVVVFVSDHGMPFPVSKATVYNNGPWCPVIMRWPGMGPTQVRQEWTSSIDIMPTLLDILGVSRQPAMDGRSWMPLLKGEKQPNRDHVISHVNTLSSKAPFPQRMVQTSTSALIFSAWSNGKRLFHCESMSGLSYKAMVEAGKTNPKIKARLDQYLLGYPLAFYDMVKDPDQRHNVIADSQYGDEVARLKQILFDYMQKTGDPEFEHYQTALAGGVVDLGAEEKEYKRTRRKKKPALEDEEG